jgi:hypothetical protein
VPHDPLTKLLKSEDFRAKLFVIAWIAQFCALAGLCIGLLILILKALKII